jgi:uncharacterized protein YdhG (YjbR/CyaY superfamily)
MGEGFEGYVETIAPEHRPLFDRVHRLVLDACPEAEVGLSYDMPTYRIGRGRLHVATWKHGLSIYGCRDGRDGGFAARHPELVSGKGTIQLTAEDAAAVTDDELRDLARAALRG